VAAHGLGDVVGVEGEVKELDVPPLGAAPGAVLVGHLGCFYAFGHVGSELAVGVARAGDEVVLALPLLLEPELGGIALLTGHEVGVGKGLLLRRTLVLLGQVLPQQVLVLLARHWLLSPRILVPLHLLGCRRGRHASLVACMGS